MRVPNHDHEWTSFEISGTPSYLDRFVYALLDDKRRIRYVGSTYRPIHRLTQHCRAAWRGTRTLDMMILFVGGNLDALRTERLYIQRLTDLGHRLKNRTYKPKNGRANMSAAHTVSA